ncbi:MAG TPA: ImmA/IrrE family metallo-endopeptidase [Propylenella sp.]|nr:ImmA/IrrE family metallo-endopeptidase [Propylenella sp.]
MSAPEEGAAAAVTPSRLRLARERRGLTLEALSRAVGVSAKTLSHYERAILPVPLRLIAVLESALGLVPGFLQAEDLGVLEEHAASFRARRRMTAAERNAALAAGRLGIKFYEWVEERFHLPDPDVPTLERFSPEQAAEIVRHRWGLGYRPVPNMVHLLESHGIRVLSLPGDTDNVDAFSTYWRSTPYVFLSLSKSPERGRFDAAHELGHLVLHCADGSLTDANRERAADQFAAAFLMPREDVLGQQLRYATAVDVVRSKRRWGVAAMALARRLHELGQMSDWEYRICCSELSKQGFRRREIDGIEREVSLVFRKVLDWARKTGLPLRKIAAELVMVEQDLHDYTFGLAVSMVDGAGDHAPRHSARSRLTLVR